MWLRYNFLLVKLSLNYFLFFKLIGLADKDQIISVSCELKSLTESNDIFAKVTSLNENEGKNEDLHEFFT